MYDKNLSEKYDLLFSDKDYEKEGKFILSKIGSGKDILDVGCGTGTHSCIISKKSNLVVGIDISKYMIEAASKKYKDIENLEFFNTSVEDYAEQSADKFDLIISMFNVVNHISSLESLLSFFAACSKLLKEEGLIIFDCWNSVACTIEEPHSKSVKTKEIDGKKYDILYETETDLMSSKVNMIVTGNIDNESIEYKLSQYLWHPKIFSDAISTNGIEKISMLNFRDFKNKATKKDYRILFVGKKVGVKDE
tara:strand:- start:489 stop:1238 length:750 start_codon:yes stop_codon:yes gene_type:complete